MFELKTIAILNGLKENIPFIINNNLVFIDSLQLISSCLDTLVNDLSDNDFKYLSQEFTDEQLKLVKQKRVYPYKYMDSFKKFSDDKLPDGARFF